MGLLPMFPTYIFYYQLLMPFYPLRYFLSISVHLDIFGDTLVTLGEFNFVLN